MTLKEKQQFWNEMKSNYMSRLGTNVDDNLRRRANIARTEIRISEIQKVLLFVESVIQELQVENNDSDEQRED